MRNPKPAVSAARLQSDATLFLRGRSHLDPKVALAEVVSWLMREWGVSDSRAMHNARIVQKRLEAQP